MVGSDDDPFDDFEFDDEALAVIEAEENKHFTQAAPRLAAPPAAKRQKTPQGWIARASSGAEEYDDLPDISINLDGSYALGNSAPPHSTQLGSAGPSTGVTQTKASVQPIRTSAPPRPPAASVLGSVRQTHIPTTNASIPSNSQTVTAPAHHAGAHSQRPFVPPRRMDNGENSQYQRGISIPRSQAPNPAPAPITRNLPYTRISNPPVNNYSSTVNPTATTPTPVGNPEVVALLARIQELSRVNEQTLASLKEAETLRFAKEGEATHLRKEIEKTNQDHNAAVARLKAAKEAAEAQKAQVERQHKEEIERLRTQMAFKQLEASSRKPPPSVRRMGRLGPEAVPPTPIRMPSQMRSWKQPDPLINSTPRSPRKSPRKSTLPPAPATSRRGDGMLPGFVNAFATSSPAARLSKQRSGGVSDSTLKRRAFEVDVPDWGMAPDTPTRPRISIESRSQRFGSRGPPLSPPSSPGRRGSSPDLGMDTDISAALLMASDVPEPPEEVAEDETEDVEDVQWRDELQRLVFAHATPWADTLTFQLLLSAQFAPEVPLDIRTNFTTGCSTILRVVGVAATGETFATLCENVAKVCIEMMHALTVGQLDMALAALLNLLSSLCTTIPLFTSALLSSSITLNASSIINYLCEIIRTRITQIVSAQHTSPGTGTERIDPKNLRHLAEETLGLFEVLTWNLSDALADHIIPFVRESGILDTLIDTSRPSWLIYRAARLGAMLASRSTLSKYMLLPADNTLHATAEIPLLKSISNVLIDSSHADGDSDDMRVALLTLVSTLASNVDSSTAHTDAHMDAFAPLLPALVLLLSRFSSLVWEDDPLLMGSVESTSSTIRTMQQTLFLLHHLVIVHGEHAGGNGSARRIFHSALANPQRIRAFNGLHHAFHVTFGRLSYANPPDWVSQGDSVEFPAAQELARDLLDLIIDGPEGDAVYGVYQGDWDEETEADDDEMQARMLQDGFN